MIITDLYQQRNQDREALNEQRLYEDWNNIGRILKEYKMSEKEILDLFAQAEAGMTDKDTGANRTFLGRGKDATMNVASKVKSAYDGIINAIQTSVPVQAVDVAYDQATDALGKLAGGQRGKVMQTIKAYRNLAKEYPKTAGFVKAALVAITGLATGGAGLPAIAGLTYALDSAIKGDKLSSVIGKGAGAAALSYAGRELHGALKGHHAAAAGPDSGSVSAQDSLGSGEEIVSPGDAANTGTGVDGTGAGGWDDAAHSFDYKVKPGDTLSDILHDRQINPEIARRLNPELFGPSGNPNLIQAGQTIRLPNPDDMDIWNRIQYTGSGEGYHGQYAANNPSSLDATNNLQQQDYGRWGSDHGMSAKRAAADAAKNTATDTATDVAKDTAGGAPIDYTQAGPISTDSLGQKLEYGIPVNSQGSFVPPNPDLPANELAAQQAAYDTWKADYLKRWPNAVQGPDGAMQNVKPGLAPVYPGFTPKSVQESIHWEAKILPAEKLFNQHLTVMTWALNESAGKPQGNSVHLTTPGAYAVFENVDRVRNAVISEIKGVPGSTRPKFFRPDMPGGPGKTSKPGLIGRGLNWLDKAAGKVGGALSNFGHQFTTNVTKEKLKNEWHQAGKPSDSDAIHAFLIKQGVPQQVADTIYSKMGIPLPSAAAPATTAQAAPASAPAQAAPTTATPATATSAPASAKGPTGLPMATSTTAGQPSKVTYGKGFNFNKPAAPAAKPATPDFSRNRFTGYTTAQGQPPKPTQPRTFTVPGGGQPPMPTPGANLSKPAGKLSPQQLDYIKKIGAPALPESVDTPVLDNVQKMVAEASSRADLRALRFFLNENLVDTKLRNEIMESATQIVAHRRREIAAKTAK